MAAEQTQDGHATHEDIVGILGNIDQDKLLAIIELRPTVAEVEKASIWLSGDEDVFGAGETLTGPAAEIVNILTAGEEEEEERTA